MSSKSPLWASARSLARPVLDAAESPRAAGYAALAVVGCYTAYRVWVDVLEIKLFHPKTWFHVPFLGAITMAFRLNWFYDDIADNINNPNNRKHYSKMRIFGQTYYMIGDPQDVEHVLKNNWKNYVVGQGARSASWSELVGQGLLNADGERWFLQRKMSAKEFTAGRFRLVMSKVFTDHATTLADQLQKEVAAAPRGGVATVDMHRWFFRLTLDAFAKIAFGVELGGLTQQSTSHFAEAFDEAQVIIANRYTLYPTVAKRIMQLLNVGPERRFKIHVRTINTFVDELITQRLREMRAQGPSDDLLCRLIRVVLLPEGTVPTNTADDEDPEQRSVFENAEALLTPEKRRLLKDLVINFLIAGRDTTAVSLCWLFYELALHPAAEAALLEEVRDATAGGTSAPSYDNMAGCHYLQACLSEAQRLHPAAPLDPKHVVQADTLPQCGACVKPGDVVSYSSFAMGRSTAIWGPDALQYRPERWLGPDGCYVKADPFKFPAFQAGPRMCLGIEMSNVELKIVTATLLQRFKFQLAPGASVNYIVSIVLQLKDGLHMTIEPRR